jgi:hypothetical protein
MEKAIWLLVTWLLASGTAYLTIPDTLQIIEQLNITGPLQICTDMKQERKANLLKEFSNKGLLRVQSIEECTTSTNNNEVKESQILLMESSDMYSFSELKYFFNTTVVGKYKPALVITNSTELIINEFDFTLDQEVLFLHSRNLNLMEIYSVNNVKTVYQLGSFKRLINNIGLMFQPSTGDFLMPLSIRRSNFQGIQLIAMTEKEASNGRLPDNFEDTSTYFKNNDTYDVTNIVTGLYIDVLKMLEESLNFSTKLEIFLNFF